MLSKLDDSILVQQAKGGDNSAFGELVRRYQPTVMRTARTWTRSSEDAADVTQETFLRAYKYLDRFKAGERFSHWLSVIAKNTAKTWLMQRAKADERFVPLEETEEAVLNQRTYELYAGDAIRRQVHDAIEELSDVNQEVVRLYYLCGYSYAEISGQLGVPQSTVRSRLQEARKQLRKEFLSMVAALRLHETLTTKEGLAGNYVTAIFEDRVGNLWFGTTNGVSRYDGVHFQNFTKEDGLAMDVVGAIFEDRVGNLWFGTGKWNVTGAGVCRYDGKTFKTFTTFDGLAGNTVMDIFEDRDGKLWFAIRDGGVSRYDGHIFFNIKKCLVNDLSWTGVLEIDRKFERHLNNGTVPEELGQAIANRWTPGNIISITKEDNSWVLTSDNGRRYTVKKADDKLNVYHGTEEYMEGRVNAIAQDASGVLWFGCYSGLTSYDGQTFRHFTKKDGLGNPWIVDLLFDQQGGLWIARAGGGESGLSRYDGVTFTRFPSDEGLPCDIVHAITSDRKDNLWFATNDGVSFYDGKAFHNCEVKAVFLFSVDFNAELQRDLDDQKIPEDLAKAFEKNDVRFFPKNASVSVQQPSEKWALGDGGQRYLVEKKQNQLHVYKKGVRAILEDRNGTLWLATPGGGVKIGVPT